MVEFARTRNPSCRVPCCGDVAGKKSSHYIPVAQTPQNAHPSKNKFGSLANLTGRRSQKKTSRYIPVTRSAANEHLPRKTLKVWRIWWGAGCRKKSYRYISVTRTPFKISLFQKGIKKSGNLTASWLQTPHYIPVAQTPSEFHPSKKFSKVRRIWRKSGRRKNPPIISLWHGSHQNFTLLKINSEVWQLWRCRGSWKNTLHLI